MPILYGMNSITWECRHGCKDDFEIIFEEYQFRRDMRNTRNLPLRLQTVSPSLSASKVSELMALWRILAIES